MPHASAEQIMRSGVGGSGYARHNDSRRSTHSVNGRELDGQIFAIYEVVQNMNTKADIPTY